MSLAWVLSWGISRKTAITAMQCCQSEWSKKSLLLLMVTVHWARVNSFGYSNPASGYYSIMTGGQTNTASGM